MKAPVETMESKWEQFADEVRRIAVPGGHLYRTAAWVELPSGSDEPNRGYWHWSDPAFVPAQPDVAKLEAAAATSAHPAPSQPGQAPDSDADLTPEQLDGMELWDRDVMLDECHRAVGAMLVRRAVAEIRRRRSQPALTADEVREAVREAIEEALRASRVAAFVPSAAERTPDAIATRVAEKLAGRVVALTAGDLDVLRSMRAWVSADVMPTVAALLDRLLARAPAVDPAQREAEFLRAQLETASSVAKRAIDDKENYELKREADLREAFVAGADWFAGGDLDDQRQSAEHAAADYARSKAGHP